MTPPCYTVVRDMDPDLVDAEYKTDDPEESDELLELVLLPAGRYPTTLKDGFVR